VCSISPSLAALVAGVRVEPTAACAPRPLGFVDQPQGRDDVIRPLGLLADRTAQQRARETETHPDPGRTRHRRFRPRGMLRRLPADVEVVPRRRARPVPEAVRQEVDRRNALDNGFHDRELARILLVTTGSPLDEKTVKKPWQRRPVSCQGPLGRGHDHRHPDRSQAGLQVIQLSDQGWEQVSISRL
jgi:hypothetical protein